jgi:hypothetical protein
VNANLFDQESNEPHLLRSLLETFEEVENNLPREVISHAAVVFGATGAGKSVLVNGAVGKRLMQQSDGKIDVDPPGGAVTKIGHRITESETLHTQICQGERTYLDAGGFFDSRGLKRDFTVSLSLYRSLSKVSHAAWIYCFDSGFLNYQRNQELFNQLKIVFQFLPNDEAIKNSFLFLVTKPKDLQGNFLTRENVVIYLYDLLRELKDPVQTKQLQFVLRNNGQWVHVYNPLVSPEFELPKEVTFAEASQGLYLFPLTPETKHAIAASIKDVAQNATAKLESFHTLSREIDSLLKKVENLRETLKSSKKQIGEDQLKCSKFESELSSDEIKRSENSYIIRDLKAEIIDRIELISEWDTNEIKKYQFDGNKWIGGPDDENEPS